MSNKIKLKIVNKTDHKFLYELLENRDPLVNISHKKLPTFSEHIKFVKSKPYSKWYIILQNDKRIGSIYLSKNDEIGIFLNNKRKGIGKEALELIIQKNPRNRYLANISPKNKKSIKFFKNQKFKLIQYTYELTKS
jgi:hypothetical protein